MLPPLRVALLGVVGILTFDVVASFASRVFAFPYVRATVGSYLIYFAIGFCAARASTVAPLRTAAIAAAVAGLAEASLGWWLSALIGPGRMTAGVELTLSRWIGVAIFVVAVAAGIGSVGGRVGRARPHINAPVS